MNARRRLAFTLALGFISTIPAGAQFETRASVAVPGEPESIAAGSFNQDGYTDLAVAGNATNQLAILTGKGDGTFEKPTFLEEGASYVVTGDLRNTGTLDLITGSAVNSVGVRLGNGNGTFGPLKTFPVPASPFFLALGDFNGDHFLDAVVADKSGGCECISVLLGNGDGTFRKAIETNSPYPLSALGLGDFNGDGILDIATVGQFGGSSEVGILLGNGDGTFHAIGSYSVYDGPQSVAVADFNGDHILDLAVAEPIGGAISIFLGNGDGTFTPAPTIGAFFPAGAISADFNGDQIPDLAVVTGLTSSVVSVFLGVGDGTFLPEMDFPAESSGALAVGDFNRDGRTDIVVGAYLDNQVVTLLNTGVADFSPTTTLNFKRQAVGTKSEAQKVTLTNTGKTPLTISAMKVAGQFGMSSNCGKGVAAGKSCTISVTFSPQSQGAKSGTVTMIDSASSKPMVIELSGTGT
ncbi:MAG TPA: FG-GAP-like repeat-containing protein [Candidatus Sulfotelmatobacter sp.]|jgi:hypothetical protein